MKQVLYTFTSPRHLLLPLLFFLAILMSQQVQHIQYGDAIGGALGAGAREAASGLTKGKSDATQKWASTIIGAVAGGGTGAATALQGEKYNRQLHQREIAWIKNHADAFAAQHPGMTREQAIAALTEQALRGVDKGWSLKLGSKDNMDAKAFLKQNNAHLFEVKSEAEFYDPTITRYGDTTTKIKDLSQQEKNNLRNLYHAYTPNASKTPLKDLYIEDLKKRGIQNAKEIINGVKNIPGGIQAAYEYLNKTPASQIASDTKEGAKAIVNHVIQTVKEGAGAAGSSGDIARNTGGTADLLNDLYSDPTAADAGRLMVDETLFEGVATIGGVAKAAGGAARAGIKSIDKSLTKDLDIKVNPLDGTVESLDNKPVKVITIDSNKYPESAQHVKDAQHSGHPSIVTVDRQGSKQNRRDSLRGSKTKPGKDRDEYPPAMFKEGGEGASVRHIDSSDNRGSGKCMGLQCADVDDGQKVIIEAK